VSFKKEGNVIHINYGQRQVGKQLLKQLKDQNEENLDAIPYSDWLKKMNAKFMVNTASNYFIKYKKQGMENEQANVFAKDDTKSEGIKYMALEILRLVSLYKEGELQDVHINNIELLAKDFASQTDFMDKNKHNKFTHYLTDMEMLHDLSEEKREQILTGYFDKE
jgi:hypothetical protein